MEPKFKKYEVVYCKKAGYVDGHADDRKISLGIVMKLPGEDGQSQDLYGIALLTPLYLKRGIKECLEHTFSAFESNLEHLPAKYRNGRLYPEFNVKSVMDLPLRELQVNREFKRHEVVYCAHEGFHDLGVIKLGVVVGLPGEDDDDRYLVHPLTPLYLKHEHSWTDHLHVRAENMEHLPGKYLSTALYPDGIIPEITKSEEDKTMAKNNNFKSVELRNGDVVVNKEGEAFIVFNGGNYVFPWMHSATTSLCYYMDSSGDWCRYSDDSVVCEDTFKAVYRPKMSFLGIKEAAGITRGDNPGVSGYSTVWEYQAAKELTVAEIEKLLGYSIKVVKEG